MAETIGFSFLTHRRPSAPAGTRRALAMGLQRLTLAAAALVAIAAAQQFAAALDTPVDALGRDLRGAAAEVRGLAWSVAAEGVQAQVTPYFPDLATAVDASAFPALVRVTIADIDGSTCAEARQQLRRLEGRVVIELEGFDRATACGERNAMTWRIMP